MGQRSLFPEPKLVLSPNSKGIFVRDNLPRANWNRLSMTKLLVTGLFLTRLSLTLQAQGGTVTGQLLDSLGRPVPAVRVAATDASLTDSAHSASVLAAIAVTDDAGRYHLENLPAGRYYIVAGLIDYPTYYPGVTDPAKARVVRIQNGTAMAGVDFVMVRPTAVKLRGHVLGLKTASSLPLALFGATGSPLETEAHSDGSFEFDKVPLGSYTLRGPGLIPSSVVLKDQDVSIDLVPLYSGPGVKVSGKVLAVADAPQYTIRRTVLLNPIATNPVTGSVRVPPGIFEDTIAGALETVVRADGSFEFPSVPPGPYLLKVLPAAPGVPSPHVDVANQDVRGLEIPVPRQFDVRGRLLAQGRNPGPNVIVEATQGNFTTSTSVLPDGTFKLRLTEGENRISLARLPTELSVKSITYGDTDITQTPIKVSRTTVPEEIVVNLEAAALESLPGVKVSGRATGAGKYSVAGLSVSLSPLDSAGKAVETMAKADGSFEFPKVVRGSYLLRFPMPVAAVSKIVVRESDVTDIEVPIAETTEVSGRVAVVNGKGIVLSGLPANLSIIFLAGSNTIGTTIDGDGRFRLPLPGNRYAVSVANVAAPYSVRSIASGPVNLMKQSLAVDTQTGVQPIEIVLEYQAER